MVFWLQFQDRYPDPVRWLKFLASDCVDVSVLFDLYFTWRVFCAACREMALGAMCAALAACRGKRPGPVAAGTVSIGVVRVALKFLKFRIKLFSLVDPDLSFQVPCQLRFASSEKKSLSKITKKETRNLFFLNLTQSLKRDMLFLFKKKLLGEKEKEKKFSS